MKITLYLFLIIGTLQAVIRRDDVSDSEYLAFGKDSRFSSVGSINCLIGSATGTLIDPFTVLTVAHFSKTANEKVTFNIVNPSTQKIESFKGYVQIHEDFVFIQTEGHLVKEIHNDIALIHLETPIYFIKPAILDYRIHKLPINLISAGYGKTGIGTETQTFYDKDKRGFTNIVREIFTKPWCDDCYLTLFEAPSSLDCTRLEGVGAEGDSGSGVFQVLNNNFQLFGLISLMAGKGTYKSFNLILPIFPYEEWIESNRHHN